MKKLKDDGFSLIELIIVVIITIILAQIGWGAFNRYSRRAKSFAAKTALQTIKKECEANTNLNTSDSFNDLSLDSYSLDAGVGNNCFGNSDGLIVANPMNKDLLPIWKYEPIEGTITCTYEGKDKSFTLQCSGQKSSDLKPWEKVSCDGNDIVVARYSVGRDGIVPDGSQTNQGRDTFMKGGGDFGHLVKTPNQDKRHPAYDGGKDKIRFYIGVFKKEEYLKLNESQTLDKKIFRTQDELVDYYSEFFEPPGPIDENLPPFMKRMRDNQPKNATEFVSQRIEGGLFDRAARDLGHKGKNYFCD